MLLKKPFNRLLSILVLLAVSATHCGTFINKPVHSVKITQNTETSKDCVYTVISNTSNKNKVMASGSIPGSFNVDYRIEEWDQSILSIQVDCKDQEPQYLMLERTLHWSVYLNAFFPFSITAVVDIITDSLWEPSPEEIKVNN